MFEYITATLKCEVNGIMKEQHNSNNKHKSKSKKIWSVAAILLTFVLLSGIISINVGFSSSQSPESDTLICITQNSALAQNDGDLTGANISYTASDKVDISESSNIWSTKAQIDIFKHNDDAVKSDGTGEANNVIAPGTSNDYTFSLQNSKDFDVKYTLNITGGNDSVYEIPIQLQILDSTGEIISGNNWTTLADFTEVNDIGSISPNNEKQYTVRWKWDFENGSDSYDTFLGNTAESEEIPCHINISIIAEYDTTTDTDTDTETVTDTDSVTDTDTATDTDSETDTDTATETDSVTDTDTSTDTDSETDTDTATDTDSVTDTDTATDISTDSNSDKDSDTDSDTTSSKITSSQTTSSKITSSSSSTSSTSPINNIISLVTTGDRRKVALVIGIFAVCAVLIAAMMIIKKKSNDD